MKKSFLTFMVAAAFVSFTAVFSSCSADAKDGEGDEDVKEVVDTTKKVADKVDTVKKVDTVQKVDTIQKADTTTNADKKETK